VKVLVFGARGWLGGRYVEHLSAAHVVVADGVTNIADMNGVARQLWRHKPEVVLNAAGRARSRAIPNIDGCVESDDMRWRTLHDNALGAGVLAHTCRNNGVRLVHIGSGCIFDGYGKAFTESDAPNPVSWYGRTKVLGDQLVTAAGGEHLVLRIRMPVSARPHPRNLVTKLAQATRVVDVANSVTVVEDLLAFTQALMEAGTSGIVHAVNAGEVSFRSLMASYRQLVDDAWHGEFVPLADYRTADGRSNCMLDTERQLPAYMPAAAASVRAMLQRYAQAVQEAA
jgi:dTDP-4-dehydrorhamnose reductase